MKTVTHSKANQDLQLPNSQCVNICGVSGFYLCKNRMPSRSWQLVESIGPAETSKSSCSKKQLL